MAQSQLHTNFEEIKIIGTGAFGEVVKARSKTDKKDYAIKIITIEKEVKVERELTALKNLEHKNVVRYYSAWLESCKLTFERSVSSEEFSGELEDLNSSTKTVCIQMELCQSTLKEKLKGKLSSFQIYNFFTQICQGLQYIHSQGIVHRDLKPDNIFISNENRLKIGDFGLSKPLNQIVGIPFGKDEASSSTSYDIGTPFYVAPETKTNGYEYDEKADLYSLGIIYFEMCHGPFNTVMERCKTLENLRLESIRMPKNFNNSYYISLIRQLLNHNPQKRLTATMILNKTPPSIDDIKDIRVLFNLNLVSKQRISILLRHITRQESVNEENVEFHQINRWPRSDAQYIELLQLITDVIRKMMKKINATYFPVPLFLPRFQVYFNIATDVCLLNERTANMYALPHDRRLCNIYYLKNCNINEPPFRKRYSIDTIYKGSMNDTYDEITECNFDSIGTDSVQSQIKLLAEFLHLWADYDSKIVINVNHVSLYNGIMKHYNISSDDQNAFQEYLLHEEVNASKLKKRLEKKTRIPPTVILEICNIFKGETNKLLQEEDFQQYIPPIKDFIGILCKENVTYPVRIKPLMLPHFYSTGIIYELALQENEDNYIQLVKGSEYKINEYSGVGFSLNLSNVVKPLLKICPSHTIQSNFLYEAMKRQQKQIQYIKLNNNNRSRNSTEL